MKVNTSTWNGKHSIRIEIKIRIGSLWFGGSFRAAHKSVWIIYNGKPFSWQVGPFSIWGYAPLCLPAIDPDSPFWQAVALMSYQAQR